MDNKVTLTDAVGNEMLSFEVDGKQFYVRQPTPEEYDDAMALQSLVYRKTLAAPHIKDVADVPCSDGERAIFQAMIDDAQRRFDESEDEVAKQSLAQELARLQTELEGRTLAEETASDTAALKRDRWLCARLLCDANGKSLFDTASKDFEKRWNKLPVRIKNEVRPLIWRALALVREAPFSLDL